MIWPPSLQRSIVEEMIRERHAEAAEARLAAVRQRPLFGALRRRIGRAFVLAGTAIAREGLVDGSAEPMATRNATGAVRRDPCPDDAESLRPAA